jgi:hypothetical protein
VSFNGAKSRAQGAERKSSPVKYALEKQNT